MAKKIDINEVDKNTKVYKRASKYFLGKQAGLTKQKAALAAGYSVPTAMQNTNKIEKSAVYQAIEQAHYKDVLLGKITMDELATAHADNITQYGQTTIDRGARNKAIEMALSKLEPDKVGNFEDEKIIVVLRNQERPQKMIDIEDENSARVVLE